MAKSSQASLLSSLTDVAVFRVLLADLHDDVEGKVARFHQRADLSNALGSSGTMLPGGETAIAAWSEARSCFVHGNFVAPVLLCQGLAEQVLAAHLAIGIHGEEIPNRISFPDGCLNVRCWSRKAGGQRVSDSCHSRVLGKGSLVAGWTTVPNFTPSLSCWTCSSTRCRTSSGRRVANGEA